jgi:hypothetical protein
MGGLQMNSLITINNNSIQVKEFNGKRVVTFKDIDELHQRPEGTASRNFRENRDKFLARTDYFHVELTTDEIRRQFGAGKNASEIYLITESGYLMLVKSFTDDLAWEVQRQLVNNYFKAKTAQPMSMEDIMITTLQEMKSVKLVLNDTVQKVEEIDSKVETQITVSFNQAKEIQFSINRRVIEFLGGKLSEEYKQYSKIYFSALHRDIKKRLGVPSYRDILKKDYEAAIRVIGGWIPESNIKLG